MTTIKKIGPGGEPPRPDRTTNTGDGPGADRSNVRTDDGNQPDSVDNETTSNRLTGTIRCGTWNIRSLRSETLCSLTSETARYDIDILGVCEHRLAGQGHFRPDDGGTFVYSGAQKSGRNGVGFYLSSKVENSMLGYNPISERIMTIRLHAKPANITIVQVYAPTSTASDQDIDEFYQALQECIDNIKNRDMWFTMGDLNAKIGQLQADAEKGIVGKYGLGERNERGDRLAEFAVENELTIMNTVFLQHPRRLYTWTSPDGNYRNQIDYIIAPKRWKSSITRVKTLPGADCGTDHELLSARVKINLKRMKRGERIIRYDVSNITDEYKVEVKNRFEELKRIAEEREPDELAREIGVIFLEAAATHLPRKRRKNKVWISDETMRKIDERKALKQLKSRSEADYSTWKMACKEVRRSCKLDREEYINEQCEQIDNMLARNDSRGAFDKMRSMTQSGKARLAVIKDESGKTLTESSEVLDRWKRYCEGMYKRSDIDTFPATSVEYDENLAPLKSEIEWAINSLKDGKTPGCDNISAEMIKASGDEGVDIYHQLCMKIWNTGTWPIDWKRSIFIPLPKKGDLQLCSNYRTIALISHASKILLKILMNRIKHKLEEEVSLAQAGFREGRGTKDHILNLNILIQKCRDFNSELRVCFIDYSKAFDCVSHQQLWKVLTQQPGH